MVTSTDLAALACAPDPVMQARAGLAGWSCPGQTWLVAFDVPAAVGRLLTADVAAEIARTFGDQLVFPQRIVTDSPAGSSPAPPGFSRRFPGWPGPVLVLSDENQGVCSWGVPSGGGGEVVVVGGDLLDAGCATVVYAASVADFIAARRWDHRCLSSGPVLQAQGLNWTWLRLATCRRGSPRRWRQRAGPGRGSTGSKAAGYRSCCGRKRASATGGSRPSARHLSASSQLACWTCPVWARRCGPTTKTASGCSVKCAADRVSRAAAATARQQSRETSRRPAPPEITHRGRRLSARTALFVPEGASGCAVAFVRSDGLAPEPPADRARYWPGLAL
jgi:hypothetical protein